jgi:hypothetical protein
VKRLVFLVAASIAYAQEPITGGRSLPAKANGTGVTVNLLAEEDASNPVQYQTAGANSCKFAGIAQSTVTSGDFYLGTVPGLPYLVVAGGAITSGHLLITGATGGRVYDSGQTDPSLVSGCIVGRAMANGTLNSPVLVRYGGQASSSSGTTITGAPGVWPTTFPPQAHASSHGNGSTDPVSLDAGQIGSGTLAAARLPNPGASSKGGVQAIDCSGTGHIQKINPDGTETCTADSGGSASDVLRFTICVAAGCGLETTLNYIAMNSSGTFSECFANLATAPTGSTVTIDVQNGSGVSIFGGTKLNLTVANGTAVVFQNVFANSLQTFARGDKFKAVVTANDSGVAAQGGTVQCK